jgi:hypothetical protein
MHSLRNVHAESAEIAVTLLGPGWSVERHETYDGHLILQVMTDDDEDCAFMLHGTAQGIRLGLFSTDSDYAILGNFDSIGNALQFAAQLIAGEAMRPKAVAPAA